MTNIVFHVEMGDGVALKLPGTWDDKNFDIIDVELVGQSIAKKLGGLFIYTEVEEDA